MNSSCVNATNCQIGLPVQTEFNGIPVVFSPINVNYNGKYFEYILYSLGLTQCSALKFEFGTPYRL